MEQKLDGLVRANDAERRAQVAGAIRQKGQKIFGLLCAYIPEELIYAAGLHPWRITGTWKEATPHALVYRIATSCRFCNHVLESFLAGEFDFLDGFVSTNLDDDVKCLWDVLDYLKKAEFRHIMHLPHKPGRLAMGIWTRSLRQLKQALEAYTGKEITDERMRVAIETCNRTRHLLAELYELRKKPDPPVSGAEVFGILTASTILPKEDFNARLEELMPYLRDRRAPLKKLRPRLLVSSDMLDHPGYIQLIEAAGAFVAMDDLDPGSRTFWRLVDPGEDPLAALAERYLNKLESPRMATWDRQVDQVIRWVQEFGVEGVVDLPLACSFPREYMRPYFSQRLSEAGIPHISVKREYHFANAEQFRTRIEAFIEMIEAGGRKS